MEKILEKNKLKEIEQSNIRQKLGKNGKRFKLIAQRFQRKCIL